MPTEKQMEAFVQQMRTSGQLRTLEEALLNLARSHYISWSRTGDAPTWETLTRAEKLNQAGRLAGVDLSWAGEEQ